MSEGLFGEPTWAIVELFGHNLIAGQVSEVSVAGAAMLRVDVPAVRDVLGFTKFYGGGAIYAITPTDQESALHAVNHLQAQPVNVWTIPVRVKVLPVLQAPDEGDWEDGNDEPVEDQQDGSLERFG